MTGIVHAMADRSDDAAVEAITRVLAIQTGLIRAGTEQQMDEAIGRLPAEARHGFRELALQYVTVVRDADGKLRAITNDPDLISCPFCGEGDFDKIGLRMHFLRFGCQAMDATPDHTPKPKIEVAVR